MQMQKKNIVILDKYSFFNQVNSSNAEEDHLKKTEIVLIVSLT